MEKTTTVDNETIEDEVNNTDDEVNASLSEVSSEDTDSGDMGDFTINLVINRGNAERYYPCIPVVRRGFILR